MNLEKLLTRGFKRKNFDNKGVNIFKYLDADSLFAYLVLRSFATCEYNKDSKEFQGAYAEVGLIELAGHLSTSQECMKRCITTLTRKKLIRAAGKGFILGQVISETEVVWFSDNLKESNVIYQTVESIKKAKEPSLLSKQRVREVLDGKSFGYDFTNEKKTRTYKGRPNTEFLRLFRTRYEKAYERNPNLSDLSEGEDRKKAIRYAKRIREKLGKDELQFLDFVFNNEVKLCRALGVDDISLNVMATNSYMKRILEFHHLGYIPDRVKSKGYSGKRTVAERYDPNDTDVPTNNVEL
jgi:hypothetical protein